jgi:formylglycine-generating enzyme required for sulfatase activity
MILKDLFEPKWKHSSPNVRVSAIKKIADEELLLQIANSDADLDVIKLAISLINDENKLLEIAKKFQFPFACGWIENKIKDEQNLIEIARDASMSDMRLEALKNISDTELAIKIAEKEEDWQIKDFVLKNKCSNLVEWVDIPAGLFTMGSPMDEIDRREYEGQKKQVIKAFKMSKYAITFEQYDLFCEAKGIKKPDDKDGKLGRGSYPVVNVDSYSAIKFSEWLGCRLPTEAEWEYACRAGTNTPFNTGNILTTDQANFDGNYPYHDNPKGKNRNSPVWVNNFTPNNWGLYQMHGNVWEWCNDLVNELNPNTDPLGIRQKEQKRITRGGSWRHSGNCCRSAFRDCSSPDSESICIGFRIVKDNLTTKLSYNKTFNNKRQQIVKCNFCGKNSHLNADKIKIMKKDYLKSVLCLLLIIPFIFLVVKSRWWLLLSVPANIFLLFGAVVNINPLQYFICPNCKKLNYRINKKNASS